MAKDKKIHLWMELADHKGAPFVLHRAPVGAVPVKGVAMTVKQARELYGDDVAHSALVRLDGTVVPWETRKE